MTRPADVAPSRPPAQPFLALLWSHTVRCETCGAVRIYDCGCHTNRARMAYCRTCGQEFARYWL